MIEPILEWTESDVFSKGGALVDSSTNPFVAGEVAKLDQWFKFPTKVYLCPGITSSACADGIVLNLDQIQYVCREQVAVDAAAVVASVLAHEKTHCAQAQMYGGWAMIKRNPILYEIQADFVAGAWIGANILLRDYNFLAVAEAAFVVGDPLWPNGQGTHPAPEQRKSAVNRGVAALASLAHMQLPGGALEGSRPVHEGIAISEIMQDSLNIARQIEAGRI